MMKKAFLARSVFAIVAPVLAATLHAQVPPVKDRVTVEVIEVPVWVTAHGSPLRGLTRDDFRLLVNGREQSIDYFDTVSYDAVGSVRDEHVGPTLARRRLFTLVFDLNSDVASVRRAQKAATAFVHQLGDHDVVAVATLRRGVEFLTSFSKDRDLTTNAIASLRPSGGSDLLRLSANGGGGQSPANPRLGGEDGEQSWFQREKGADHGLVDMGQLERFARDGGLLRSVAGLGGQLRVLDGEKHIVLLSDGLVLPQISDDVSFGNQLQNTFDAIRAGGVMIDTVNIASLRVPGFGSADSRFLTVPYGHDDVDGLASLAIGTGGTACDPRGDLQTAFREVREATNDGYILGFTARGSDVRRTITVELRTRIPGARLRYRDVIAKGDGGTPRMSGLRLADAVLNDYVRSDVSATVETSARRESKTRITLRMNSGEFAAVLGGRAANVRILYYVFRRNTQNAVAAVTRSVAVNAAPTDVRDVAAFADFALASGEYTAKVLALVGNDIVVYGRRDFEVGADR